MLGLGGAMRWLQFLLALVELPVVPSERDFWRSLARLQFLYAVGGLFLGLLCIVIGMVLFLHGISGATGWLGRVFGVESRLSDAAPGTVLFVVGLAIVWVTRFQVRLRNGRTHTARLDVRIEEHPAHRRRKAS
jgi:hypothetical protein